VTARHGVGVLCLAFYGAHAAYYAVQARPLVNMLWMCHLASVLIAAGLLARVPSLNAVGVLWLLIGLPLWFLDLARGGAFHPTSTLTHVGGLAAGLWGARRLGFPAGAWWRAVLGMIALLLLSRAVTPPAENVNLAFAVWTGWEAVFPSHPLYVLALLVTSAGLFAAATPLLRRLAS
jgi:hypothetical protein